MFKKITLLLAAALVAVSTLKAQTRYVDPMFEVSDDSTAVYGANVDVFLSALNNLEVDIYEPVDDDAPLRPLVVVFPTGNFLIQYLNQGAFGSRKDSAAVEIINQVVSRGYVGMVAEYRTGWLPTATDQDIRTSTLLQAAYRGGQDAHTLARWLRKTVVDEGNPMRIDTSRIVYWGLGTGGYVTMTHAFLDNVDEILDDERFYDVNDEPYVDIAVNADPQGLLPAFFDPTTMTTPSNIPNWVGFNSHVAMSINCNGALGDIDWMTGADTEPLVLGYHSPTDPFAPFNRGNVVVPTTGDIVIPGVAGTEQILKKANELGINDKIMAANAVPLPAPYPALSTAVNAVNAAYKGVTINLGQLGQDTLVALSHDNMFPTSVGDSRTTTGAVGATYNWIDSVRVRAEVAAFNAEFEQEIDADDVISQERLTNPNAYDAAGARVVLDTFMAHFIPRAYIGLDLDQLVSTEDLIDAQSIGLTIQPNPANQYFELNTEAGHPIREIHLFDINGRNVATYTGINQTRFRVDRGNLPRGTYVVRLRLDEGVAARKLILR